MIRLIGILIGSAIAVGLLIVTFGIPEFAAPEPKPAVQILPATEPAPQPAAAEVAPTEPPPQRVATETIEPEPLDSVPTTRLTDEQLVEQIFAPQPDPVLEEHWYAFWSPFRSEIAANGFVSRLQETTGMDYRVVKLKPGVYEVAFAYSDDNDIQDKLTRISTATGLDLGGG